ncbi:MAG: D-tagaturonate epimerase UxaE [Anaerolineae bacterium]
MSAGARFSIVHTPQGRRLHIEADTLPEGFSGQQEGNAFLCDLTHANAIALRAALPWTAPVTVGLRKSAGCGDRLGVATPGHIRAIAKTDVFPVFAQQSIREMQRAGRSAEAVLDDATWGVLEANYQTGFGSDADHLKNTEVIDQTIAAGFTGFTLDPSEYVDNAAHSDDAATLQHKYANLPWEALETSPDALQRMYEGASPAGEFTAAMIHRAACKYSQALAHVAHLAQHIADRMNGRAYDLEVSVDETDTPTSPAEHYFIANELRRLGVNYQGLAPRFIGSFEKGVDYIGDLSAFTDDFAVHARIARELGPYKLSIHSGSDKFSIYGIIAQYANPYVHLKTAGTSWVEALRVIAMHDPALMREMVDFAVERYPTDRASYHVSGEIENVRVPEDDAALPALLDHFDTRQIMHVTFGSLMGHFRAPLYTVLEANLEDYYRVLEGHFDRHLSPFAERS